MGAMEPRGGAHGVQSMGSSSVSGGEGLVMVRSLLASSRPAVGDDEGGRLKGGMARRVADPRVEWMVRGAGMW